MWQLYMQVTSVMWAYELFHMTSKDERRMIFLFQVVVAQVNGHWQSSIHNVCFVQLGLYLDVSWRSNCYKFTFDSLCVAMRRHTMNTNRWTFCSVVRASSGSSKTTFWWGLRNKHHCEYVALETSRVLHLLFYLLLIRHHFTHILV